MRKKLLLLFAISSYLFFLLSSAYMVAFLMNLDVPYRVDAGKEATSVLDAFIIDFLLISIFACQHSVMARQGFKRWLKQYIPDLIERSIYVFFSSLALVLIFVFWVPNRQPLYDLSDMIPEVIFWLLIACGFVILSWATFLVNHFELFGLRQAWLHYRQQKYRELDFEEKSLYRWIRHPIMLGTLIILWASPQMSLGHFWFSGLMTVYMLIGIHFEEKSLLQQHGELYRNYQSRTWKLVPYFY